MPADRRSPATKLMCRTRRTIRPVRMLPGLLLREISVAANIAPDIHDTDGQARARSRRRDYSLRQCGCDRGEMLSNQGADVPYQLQHTYTGSDEDNSEDPMRLL